MPIGVEATNTGDGSKVPFDLHAKNKNCSFFLHGQAALPVPEGGTNRKSSQSRCEAGPICQDMQRQVRAAHFRNSTSAPQQGNQGTYYGTIEPSTLNQLETFPYFSAQVKRQG